jgi:E3 ubiquitin-protein ligase RNF115/126
MVTELVFMSSHRPFRPLRSSGDAGEADSSFDALIHQLMQNDPNRYGPPPASKESLSLLPEVLITDVLIQQRGTRHQGVDEFGYQIDQNKTMLECSVCQEELETNNLAIELPCGHLFHKQCILSWLEAHNNCPVCRLELPTDDADYEARKMRK